MIIEAILTSCLRPKIDGNNNHYQKPKASLVEELELYKIKKNFWKMFDFDGGDEF